MSHVFGATKCVRRHLLLQGMADVLSTLDAHPIKYVTWGAFIGWFCSVSVGLTLCIRIGYRCDHAYLHSHSLTSRARAISRGRTCTHALNSLTADPFVHTLNYPLPIRKHTHSNTLTLTHSLTRSPRQNTSISDGHAGGGSRHRSRQNQREDRLGTGDSPVRHEMMATTNIAI